MPATKRWWFCRRHTRFSYEWEKIFRIKKRIFTF